MPEIIIGIDLGTTNSEVAVVENGRAVVIGDAGSQIVPSYVGVADDGQMLVGESAKNQYAVYPERTIKSIKRKMGSGERVQLAGQEYSPQEISAIILRRLKDKAEAYLGQAVSKAVITVPAYFNDAQRQATREAGEIAGVEVVRIINEPTAAALAYEVENQSRRHILVYDLGGGTFDVSLVKLEDDVVEVVASHGNNHLGGDDFDEKILDLLVSHLHEQYDVDVRRDAKVVARLLRVSEQAKKALSDQPFVNLEEEYLLEHRGQPIHLKLELSRLDYEEMITGFVDETLDAIHIALKSATLTVGDIDEILLVGGATRTPLIRERLEAVFSKQPRGEINPDLCVAMGAAVQAAINSGQTVSTYLVDVTPYAFGTSAVGEIDGIPTFDQYVPIIHKNTPIPVSKTEAFQTMNDGQEKVEVKIFQGENPIASSNIEIGNFMVEGLSDVPAGNSILLKLALDLDGVLNVTAMEKDTGLEKSIRIDNSIARLETKALVAAKQRLEVLFDNDAPQDEVSRNDDVEQLKAQSQALIKKAENMLDSAALEDKEDIIQLIENIHDALRDNACDALHAAMEELEDILYYMES